MGPSHAELRCAESILRRYDKAVRLRYSGMAPNRILVERKTYRGRIGAVGLSGFDYSFDAGYRAEHGHVAVASMPAEIFNVTALLETLKAADSWKRWDFNARPLYEQVEQREQTEQERKKKRRQDALRYKASDFFDVYSWKVKSRVSVPVQVK